MRLLAVPVLLAALGACTPLGPRMLVYEFDDGEPVGRLDREACVSGFGLRVALGPTEAIAFDISSDQSTALLASCDLENSTVLECGALEPQVPLEIENNVVTGTGRIGATFPGSDCSGADVEATWTMLLDDDETHIDAVTELVWRLHETPECDQFEADVIDSLGGSGRIEGCLVQYQWSATMVADCKVDDSTLFCD